MNHSEIVRFLWGVASGWGRFRRRFFFFSREETRLHVHVLSATGEAKYWLEPDIALAKNYGFGARDLRKIEQLIADHEKEIRDAWNRHFRG